jgi:hypothetical protein
MRNFYNTDIRDFHTQGITQNPVAWRAESPAHRGNQFRSSGAITALRSEFSESHPLPVEPQITELPGDDFSLNALIQFVRQMRQ